MSFTAAARGTNGQVAGIAARAILWIVCALALALTGCGLFGSKSSSYEPEAKHEGPLEVPPDLAALPKDERYALPDQATSANALRSAAGGASGSQAVALAGVHARVMRDGAQRWLVVDVPPEKAYQVAKDFWPTVGFAVKSDDPAVGVLETDWVEKRPSVPSGLIQQALNLVLESVTSTGLKDEFRTRVERTPTDTSEIYITHYGLEEVYSSPAKTTTTWQPRAREPELEAEMLQRLLLRFETGESGGKVAKAGSGKGSATTATAAPAVTVLPSVSRIVKDGTESHLEVDEPFDRAWRRVGLALDRGGFTVEDRDRAKGLYFVRYLDPDYEAKKRDSRGFFTKIFEQDAKVDPQQFRVALLTEGERTSVRVQDKDGHPEASSAGDRILKQLDEQMR
jgi:outer membrane protein assembly factor BamC